MLDLAFDSCYVVRGDGIDNKVGGVLAVEHDVCQDIHCKTFLFHSQNRDLH